MTADEDSIYHNKNYANVNISKFKKLFLNKDSVKYSPTIFFKKISF